MCSEFVVFFFNTLEKFGCNRAETFSTEPPPQIAPTYYFPRKRHAERIACTRLIYFHSKYLFTKTSETAVCCESYRKSSSVLEMFNFIACVRKFQLVCNRKTCCNNNASRVRSATIRTRSKSHRREHKIIFGAPICLFRRDEFEKCKKTQSSKKENKI